MSFGALTAERSNACGKIQVGAALQVAQILEPLGDRRHPAPLPGRRRRLEQARPHRHQPGRRRRRHRPAGHHQHHQPAANAATDRRRGSPTDAWRAAAATRGGVGTPATATPTRRTPGRPRRRDQQAFGGVHTGTSSTVAVRIGHPDAAQRPVRVVAGPALVEVGEVHVDLVQQAGRPRRGRSPAPGRRRLRRRLVEGVDLGVVALHQRVHDLADPPVRLRAIAQCTTRSNALYTIRRAR